MEQTPRNWMELITEMLWVFEREAKFTLRGINDVFKDSGLSFDADFRSHFLQIIAKRIAKTYDQYVMNIRNEGSEHRGDPSMLDNENAFLAWQRLAGQNHRTDPMPERSSTAVQKRRNPNPNHNGFIDTVNATLVNNEPARLNGQERMVNTVEVIVEEERFIDDYEVLGNENIVEMIESDEEVDVIDDERRISEVRVMETANDANTISEADNQSIMTKRSGRVSRAPLRFRASGRVVAANDSNCISTPHSTTLVTIPAANTQFRPSNPVTATPSSADANQSCFRCKICGYTNSVRSNYVRHLLDHQKRPHQCDMCPRKFANKSLLEQHDNIHKHRCRRCTKQFSGTNDRRLHEKHCQTMRLKCIQCNFRTINNCNLKRHMTSHTNERPFKCKLCPHTYKSKRSLQDHMRKIHKVNE